MGKYNADNFERINWRTNGWMLSITLSGRYKTPYNEFLRRFVIRVHQNSSVIDVDIPSFVTYSDTPFNRQVGVVGFYNHRCSKNVSVNGYKELADVINNITELREIEQVLALDYKTVNDYIDQQSRVRLAKAKESRDINEYRRIKKIEEIIDQLLPSWSDAVFESISSSSGLAAARMAAVENLSINRVIRLAKLVSVYLGVEFKQTDDSYEFLDIVVEACIEYYRSGGDLVHLNECN